MFIRDFSRHRVFISANIKKRIRKAFLIFYYQEKLQKVLTRVIISRTTAIYKMMIFHDQQHIKVEPIDI